jgi:type IV secretion system protein TrbG
MLLGAAGSVSANPISAPSAAAPPVPSAPGAVTAPSVADPVTLPAAVPPAPPAAAESCNTAECRSRGNEGSMKARNGADKAPSIQIGPPAQRALAESHEWAENPNALPMRDAGGRVLFMFGQSVPTVVCAPIHVCDIELQPGEVVQGAPHIGDAVRWRISPAVSGTAEQRVIHLIVKPTEADLDTNLIIPTDRHTYHLRLVSSTTRYVSSVAFYYPEDQQKPWSDLAKETHHSSSSGTGGSDTGSDMPTVAVNRLNFNYRIKVVKGKPQFRPLRAMDDGYHTYISMNEDITQQDAPILVGISSSGTEQMVNYRLKGNLFVIDGTLAKLALISGVGKQQQRIELTRDPCRTRGWLGICWDAKE